MLNLTRKAVLLTASFAGIASIAPAALAHDHDRDRVGVDIRIGESDCRPLVRERVTRVWVEPVYRTVCDRVWVAPVYRTECSRVWVEPVYKTACEQVWVPDRFEIRETVRWEHGRRIVCRDSVLVCPGHFDKVERQILVCDGHWQNVERQVLVADGHYDRVERQELVTPGHYEDRVQRVEVRERPTGFLGLGFSFRD